MSTLDDWLDIARVGLCIDGRTLAVGRLTPERLREIAGTFSPSVPVFAAHEAEGEPAAWIAEVRLTGQALQAKLRDIDPFFRHLCGVGELFGRSLAIRDGAMAHLAFCGEGYTPGSWPLDPPHFLEAGRFPSMEEYRRRKAFIEHDCAAFAKREVATVLKRATGINFISVDQDARFYFQTGSGRRAATIYVKAAGTWNKLVDIDQGADGRTWHGGSGAPSNELGEVGDWYFRTSNGYVYEKTGSSTWTFRRDQTGPQGNNGPPGPPGPRTWTLLGSPNQASHGGPRAVQTGSLSGYDTIAAVGRIGVSSGVVFIPVSRIPVRVPVATSTSTAVGQFLESSGGRGVGFYRSGSTTYYNSRSSGDSVIIQQIWGIEH